MIIADMTPQEFGALFTRYRDKYVTIAMSYVRDQSVAEDIVAESFTAFWDNHDRIELRTAPEAYILQAVKNRCLNHLRDRMTRMRIRQEMHTDAYKALIVETEMLASEDLGFLFEADVAKIFREFLSSLPMQTRDIFCASRFEGLTYNEIAEKYGITPRKVKREISQTLSRMRARLKDYLPLLLIFFTQL